MEEQKKPLSLIERMKLKAQGQQTYGTIEQKDACVGAVDCPNCGAGRAKHDGVTKCAYCGFTFTENKLTNGIHITEKDNSK